MDWKYVFGWGLVKCVSKCRWWMPTDGLEICACPFQAAERISRELERPGNSFLGAGGRPPLAPSPFCTKKRFTMSFQIGAGNHLGYPPFPLPVSGAAQHKGSTVIAALSRQFSGLQSRFTCLCVARDNAAVQPTNTATATTNAPSYISSLNDTRKKSPSNMSDFAMYDGPSPEWLSLSSTLPPTPPSANLSPSEILARKEANNALRKQVSAAELAPLAPWLKIQTHSITTRDNFPLEARTYRPVSVPEDELLPVYIHLHGGGFLFGTLASEDAACARVAVDARVVVLNVNYRHTPEWRYPTAWEDVEDAFLWLHEQIKAGEVKGVDPERVVVGGISAGAYLAASLVLGRHLGLDLVREEVRSKTLPAIKGQVLMIPCLVNMECYGPLLERLSEPEKGSWESCKDAPVLPREVCKLFMDLLKVEKPDVDNRRMNPGLADLNQVKGLPPTVFGIAGLDPLRDEGLLYAKILTEAGVPTDVNLFLGVPHGFRRFGDKLEKECKRWDRVVVQGILWALSAPEATEVFEVKTE